MRINMKATPLNHQKELIEHLSREIQSYTKAMMDFRSRINFTLYVGPFVLMGSYLIATRDSSFCIVWDTFTIFWSIFLGIIWLLLGLTGSILEEHIWDKCNEWRRLIFQLQSNNPVVLTQEDLIFEHHLRRCYILVHLNLLASIVLVLVILNHQPAPTSSTTTPAANSSIKELAPAKPDSLR